MTTPKHVFILKGCYSYEEENILAVYLNGTKATEDFQRCMAYKQTEPKAPDIDNELPHDKRFSGPEWEAHIKADVAYRAGLPYGSDYDFYALVSHEIIS